MINKGCSMVCPAIDGEQCVRDHDSCSRGFSRCLAHDVPLAAVSSITAISIA